MGPELAWTGSEFGAAWVKGGGLRFARIGMDGQRIGATLEDTGPAHGTPRLVWTGTQFGIAYGSTGYLGFGEIAFVPVLCGCIDTDNDGVATCAGDCDDADASTYPGAPELCDGAANDCDAPDWPELPAQEVDADQDRFMVCEGDCDDGDAAVHPGQQEICNGVDDDCDGRTDEDAAGEDSDGDAIHNLCDNCPAEPNPLQTDTDADAVGDVCDNCALVWNPTQADIDGDMEGDRCDLNDGYNYVLFSLATRLEWDWETGFDAWNCYCGDLDELRATGAYTQPPGANPLADRVCGLATPGMDDFASPPEGKVAFYLVTGIQGGVESTLGTNGFGQTRPNGAPCP